jgi:ribosomal protein S18 acetylase RimI-like enzyme
VSAVTNQETYKFKELKPRPIPVEKFAELMKLIARVALIVAVAGFCTAFAGAVGLTEIGVSVTSSAIGGAVVGTLAGVVLAYLIPHPSKIGQYRLDTIKDIESQLGTDNKSEHKFGEIRNLLNYPLTNFRQTFDNHSIHNIFTFIAEKIVDSHREDLKNVWKVFLEHLNRTKVMIPDGSTVVLDFSSELDRLEGKKMEYKMEMLDPKSPTYDNDLEQVEGLQKVCFGKVGTFVKEKLKEELANEGSGCAVARRKDSQELLGFAWYRKNNNIVTICGVGHAPGAAMLQIGDQLMWGVMNAQKPDQTVQLQVRKSNPALRLYKRWHFEQKEVKADYYNDPKEDAILMELNWKNYLEWRAELVKKQQESTQS